MRTFSLCLFIIFFCLKYQFGFSLHNNNNHTVKHLCGREQRQLLLELKQQLPPGAERPRSYSKTKYWNESWDCCLWDGVTCDESTGYVIGLDLSLSNLNGSIHSNSSLFRLTHLRKLNLSWNYLSDSEISFKFGRLNSLTHLDLSYSGFRGKIPQEFYHLSNLVSLDLSLNWNLNCDVKLLLGNMTKINVLYLRGVNISSEMPTNMSSFLTHLDLSDTGIHGKLPVTIFENLNLQVLRLSGNDGLEGSLPASLNRSNVHSIKELDLSSTSISGRLPESIGFMNKLNAISLGYCYFSGPIPQTIGNLTEVTEIYLAGNEFSGQVPSTISNLRHLTYLQLSYNRLQGQLPDAFSSLQKLTYLILSSNYFEGSIPSFLTNMSQLYLLDISSNALTGPFPSRAGCGLQKVHRIDLSNNSIQGMIPSWLLSLPSLESLDLSSNRLTGQTRKLNSKNLTYLDLSNNQLEIELESFHDLNKIESLRLSNNKVTEHAREVVNVTLSNLRTLELSSCEIKEFPDLLRKMPSLYFLDLSNNKIHGSIPNWFTSIRWSVLSSLNLSNNHLTFAEHLPSQFRYLDLHTNLLRGTFPSSVCNMSQLSILNLSNNKLRGKIPECIGNFRDSIRILDLSRNAFHGEIPTTIGGGDCPLISLSLNENHLDGPLPRSLANCTRLEIFDLGNNMINDTFPWWLETLPQLKILILRSNRFHGSIRPPVSNNSLNELKIIDLSYNNFDGLLPEKLFVGLQALRNVDQALTHFDRRPCTMDRPCRRLGSTEYWSSLESGRYQYSVTLSVKGAKVEVNKQLRIFTTIDLSSNNFHGGIPESLAYLYSLRLINLSHNNINGSIPPALGHLTKLEQLDLSSNQLTGGIPQTLTNLTFLSILNLSHNHLVGPIPKGNQFWTFSSDSYIGNSGLCGFPLVKNCGDDKAPPSPVVDQEEDDSGFFSGFTWKAVVLGYGCGVVFGFILGNVMISIGKPKWFARVYYVEAAAWLRRRKKRGLVVQGRR